MMRLVDLGDGCWIWLDSLDALLPPDMHVILEELGNNLSQKELEFYGRKFLMPRLTAWFGDKEYSYSGTINKPSTMPPTIEEVRNKIELRCADLPGFKRRGHTLNSVLCNYYRDGQDSIDWHSDNEKNLGPSEDNTLIASLTLGDARKFSLKNKKTKQKLSFDLGDGDLLVMGGKTQKYWLHKSPKTSKKVGPRLNLTYRVIK